MSTVLNKKVCIVKVSSSYADIRIMVNEVYDGLAAIGIKPSDIEEQWNSTATNSGRVQYMCAITYITPVSE